MLCCIQFLKIYLQGNFFVQGACAVWHNLMRNGEGDYDTRHAACPVLTGSKWGKFKLHK